MNENNKIELNPWYSWLIDLEKDIEGVCYKFIDADEFLNIKSKEESQLVYWSELIQRIHVCATTSILRIKKWYDAAIAAYEKENYYGFCASLRGLIEACSDTFYTTIKIIEPISEIFCTIELALRGGAQKFVLSKGIDDELIHYTFARKLSKVEKSEVEKCHEAKQIRDYLNSLDNRDVNDLYSELCQVSHPSMMSLNAFLLSTDEHPLILHKEKIDNDLNNNLLRRSKKAILDATKMALIPAVCLLKLINEFDAPITDPLKIRSNSIDQISNHELWKKLLINISESKIS